MRLGFSYQNLNDFDKAIASYQKAASSNPPAAALNVLHWRMAVCYANKKDRTNTLASLDKAAAAGFIGLPQLDGALFSFVAEDQGFKKSKEKVYNNAYPCMTDPKYREFDFWLGEWDVYLTSNLSVKTGYNKIEMASEGCALVENWQSAGAHNGKSFNFFNPNSQKWEQYWMGSGKDGQIFHDGVFAYNAMQFKWEGTTSTGNAITGRLTFTRLDADKVRQHSEQSFDEGKTWQTVYDFTYIRRK
jgi:hypothetical protein